MPDFQQRKIYFSEDFSSDSLNESTVGRKGLSIFKLKDIDVPVPNFFVVSSEVYSNFIYSAFGGKIDSYLKEKTLPNPEEVKKIIFSSKFSDDFEEELLKFYAKLSGFSDAWVSVRSSVVYLPDTDITFPGVFDTKVNIRGYDSLKEAMKKVYASVFTESVVEYSREHNIDLSQLRMSLVVQKMVQAEVSGITYTKDLITQDNSKMNIEAVFGLGDVISKGEITPDSYILNKKDLSFIEKNITPQDWMNVRSLKSKGLSGVEKVTISSSWSHKQKLNDKALRDVAKICLVIEDCIGPDKNIEWVWESGKVWIIQFKSIDFSRNVKQEDPTDVVRGKGVFDPVLGILQKNEQILNAQNSAVRQVMKNEPKLKDKLGVSVEKEEEKKEVVCDEKLKDLSEKFSKFSLKEEEKKKKVVEKKEVSMKKDREKIISNIAKDLLVDNLNMSNFNFLLNGIGVSSGFKVGKVIHINSKNFKDALVTREHIVVVKEPFDGIKDVIYRAGGVLMDKGGITSDVSILCRELSIPAVVGAGEASDNLNDSDFVKLDAGSGAIYLYGEKSQPVEKEELVIEYEGVKKNTDKEKKKNVSVSNINDLNYEVVGSVKPIASIKKKDVVKKEQVLKKEEVVLPIPEKEQEVVDIPKTASKVFISDKGLSDIKSYILEDTDGLVFCDLESLMIEEKRHPLAFIDDGKSLEYTSHISKKISDISESFTNKEVIISLGNHISAEFTDLVRGKSFENESTIRGVYRYIMYPNFTDLVFKIISRVRNVHRKTNISIAFHSPLGGENMKAIKKKVLAAGLRRCSTFKIYAILDNPSEVLLVEEIVNSSIDGLIINSPLLSKQLQGIPVTDNTTVFSLESNSLFKTLENIKDRLKNFDIEIFCITNNSEDLIKKCVELGFSGIVVDGEKFLELKQVISKKETEVILSRGKI